MLISIRFSKYPSMKYVVRPKISGNRERKLFETKAEAETYGQQKETELLNQGREEFSFNRGCG